jgi:hypothetical protein
MVSQALTNKYRYSFSFIADSICSPTCAFTDSPFFLTPYFDAPGWARIGTPDLIVCFNKIKYLLFFIANHRYSPMKKQADNWVVDTMKGMGKAN